jgi:hypothetical protein
MKRTRYWQAGVAAVGVTLLVAVVSPNALARPKGFVFTPLAFLGDPTPGGDTYLDVFESNFINNRGDVLFGANVTTDAEQALFLLKKGETSQIARVGEPAPGGGIFGPGFLSPTALNDKGDAGFVFLLDPFSFPVGVNAGVYRFSSATGTVTPVVIPGVTPAPGGGVFAGSQFGVSLNARGQLAFPGLVPTDKGIPFPEHLGLGLGIFEARKTGAISSVVSPGDPAPGGGAFDFAGAPWINNRGDVAFMGHVAGDECLPAGSPPPSIIIACLPGVYVKDAATGEIRSIAQAGDAAPGGGVYRAAISPVLNDRGDVVFLGDLTPPPAADLVTGVYLHSGGVTTNVARPDDPMPGGGRFVTASNLIGWQVHVNNSGEVVFNATLDTDANADGVPDTGLYVWSGGSLHLVARTGTVIPDVGTIAHLVMNVVVFPPPTVFVPNSGANNNDRGQVLFGATLSDGRGVLLLATPKP